MICAAAMGETKGSKYSAGKPDERITNLALVASVPDTNQETAATFVHAAARGNIRLGVSPGLTSRAVHRQ